MALIALVACCDTKYHELCFAKQKILESGNQVLVIDIATGPDIRFKADITRETVLEIGGHTWEQVHNMAKSDAISAMTESISATMDKLYAEKKMDGVLGMGGLQNTVVCSAAFCRLPYGFPKMICSTIASGYRYFDTVVGDKDIAVMPSIVDFAGMNPINEVTLSNAIGALIGMVQYGGHLIDMRGEKYIATTLMGITNDTVVRAADLLADRGFKTISFHSTGIGGRVMERLIEDHEVAPYYLDANFNCVPFNSLTVNTDTWDSLPTEVQNILAEVGDGYLEYEADYISKVHAKDLEDIVAKGGTVDTLSEEEQQKWAASLPDIVNNLVKSLTDAGYKGSEIVARYYELLAAEGVQQVRDWNLNL